jgi:pimeloyl-ACP methyl ester carboxylesterase
MKTQPVLLLHCSGSSGAQWRSLAAKLGSGFRAIAPDLMGYGAAAPWLGSGEFSLAQEAAALAGSLHRLGEPAHLIGHSYGGAVALHLARTRPGMFRSLTLIEPSAFHLLRGGDAIDRAALDEIGAVAAQAGADLARGAQLEGFGRFVDYWSGQGAWAGMAAEKRAPFSTQLATVVHNFQALLNEPASLGDLRGLALPVLLVQGGLTQLPSRCVCKRLRDAHPAWRFSVVRGAGHMLPLTHRDAVNQLVAEHVESFSTRLEREAA